MIKKRIVLLVALVFGAFAAQVLAANGLAEVRLSFEKSAFRASEEVLVKVSISNPNRGSIKILRWLMPVDGVNDDLFAVTIDGNTVEYIGKHFKRPAPTDKDFIILRSGETIETTIDLAGFYDLSKTGFYQVSYNVESYNLYAKDANFLNRSELKSSAVQTWIDGRDTKLQPAPVDSVVGSTGFTGCTSSRQTSLLNARDDAYNYSVDSYNYLLAGTVGARYTTWFGTYNSSRYNTVRGNFLNIRDAMNNASVNFNCGCTSSAYAYVYANQPYTIYLCNAFWSAPSTGTDSKAGTLVHEMSHFTVVAGTDDYAYGQTNAKRLASTNPKRAIKNADNHEYFAENTPFQP